MKQSETYEAAGGFLYLHNIPVSVTKYYTSYP